MLTKQSIKRPYTVVVFILIIMIVGMIAVFNMPIDLLPNMDIPVMVVATVAPGQSPEQVEKLVTAPLENGLRQINNIDKVTSISSENVSIIILQFTEKVNLTNATLDIQAKVKEASPNFPSMTMESIVMKIDPNSQAVMNLAVSQEGKSLSESSAYLNSIADKLKAASGVAGVNVGGAIEDMLALQLDMTHAAKSIMDKVKTTVMLGVENGTMPLPSEADELLKILLGLSMDTDNPPIIPDFGLGTDGLLAMVSSLANAINPSIIETAIQASNFEMPAGQVTVGGVSYFVKVGNSVKDLAEFKGLPLLGLNINNILPDVDKIQQLYESGKIDSAEKDKQIAQAESFVYFKKVGIEDVGVERKLFASQKVADMLKQFLTVNGVPDAVRDSAINKLFIGDKFQFAEGIQSYVAKFPDVTAEMQDIARIQTLNNASTQHAMINGSAGVLLSIMKQPGFSTADVSNDVRASLKSMQKEDPSLNCIVLYDQGSDINFMISTIAMNLGLGALFAILILLFFLRDIRPTFTVGVSIVISVVGALGLMYLCGVTLNLVSMGGLALAVGMLVDNSIVVIENIYRKRREGMSAIKASYEGAKQVSGAIISSTITTVVVFLPIIFVNGMVKQIFADLALTIAFSLGASLLVALTLVPMLASRMLKKEAKPESKFFEKINNGYSKALNFALNKKWITLLVVIVMFSVAMVGVFFMNKELFPATSLDNFSVGLNVDTAVLSDKYKNATYNEAISDIIDDVYSAVKLNPNVENVGIELSKGSSYAGINLGGGQIIAYVDLKAKYKGKPKKIKAAIEESLKSIDYYKNGVLSPYNTSTTQLLGDTNTLSVDVTGNDLTKMRKSVGEIAEAIKGAGFTNVTTGLEKAPQEYQIVVDRKKANAYGLLPAHVYLTVAELLQQPGSNVNIKFEDMTNQSKIYVYDFDYTLKTWHTAKLKKDGSVIRMYLGDSEFDRYVLIGGEKKQVYNISDAQGNKFYYYEDGAEAVYFTDISEEVYYDAERNKELDLVTETLKFGTILANPQYSALFTEAQREVLNKGVELYKLLDFEESCTKDNSGYVAFRDGSTDIPVAIARKDSIASINRVDGKRVFTIKVKVPDGDNVNKAKAAIQKVIKDYNPPIDVTAEFVGEDELVTMVFNSLYLILGLAIVFIYLVMVAQFQSLKSPLIIMFTMPLAFTGSILLLWACGMSLSVFAMVGLILLVGLVVNNGIVFVDYVNKLMLTGMTKREALLKTGKDRLRPILMTALTTIVALLASVIDQSPSAESIKPMAIATIGGLTYATLLTLFFVPIMYDLFNRKDRIKAIKFDDDKEVDIEAEMRLNAIENLADVLPSNTLADSEHLILEMSASGNVETPMETAILQDYQAAELVAKRQNQFFKRIKKEANKIGDDDTQVAAQLPQKEVDDGKTDGHVIIAETCLKGQEDLKDLVTPTIVNEDNLGKPDKNAFADEPSKQRKAKKPRAK